MFKGSSAKYYQNNKERLQKKACKRYQSLWRRKRKKAAIWIMNDTIVLQNNNLESSFHEAYKDVLKNQFWSYKFTSDE